MHHTSSTLESNNNSGLSIHVRDVKYCLNIYRPVCFGLDGILDNEEDALKGDGKLYEMMSRMFLGETENDLHFPLTRFQENCLEIAQCLCRNAE